MAKGLWTRTSEQPVGSSRRRGAAATGRPTSRPHPTPSSTRTRSSDAALDRTESSGARSPPDMLTLPWMVRNPPHSPPRTAPGHPATAPRASTPVIENAQAGTHLRDFALPVPLLGVAKPSPERRRPIRFDGLPNVRINKISSHNNKNEHKKKTVGETRPNNGRREND